MRRLPGLRRIIVELSTKDIAQALGESPRVNSKIRSIEFLNILRSTPREFTAICRVQFKDPATRFGDVFTDPSEQVVVLQTEKTGTYTCFYRRSPLRRLLRLGSSVRGGYISLPYEIKDGRVRISLLGSAKSIQRFQESLRVNRLRHKVVSLGDAKFSNGSPAQSLTEKQRRIIQLAFRLGYYDLPRRVDSKDLARRVGIREATLVVHRRKAERRLFAEILNKD